MSKNQPNPVLAIALDAAEPSLVERWMNDGTLPNLKRLRFKGAYGRLKSSAKWLAGSPWPTFYTGTPPSEHGLYENIQWQAERMQNSVVNPDWLPLRPFYRNLGKGLRVISIDLPMTYPPEYINGIEICSWLTYDSLGTVEGKPVSYPTTEIDQIRDRFSLEPTLITSEGWGLQKIKSLLRIRDQLIQATHCTGKLARTLMRIEKWDLFMLALAAPHRGGHKLWDLSGTYGSIGAGDQEEFSNAIRDIYIACDKVVGQLVETASDDSKILVFSLHGMGPNTNRSYFLPKVLPLILARKSKYGQKPNGRYSSLFERIKDYVPLIWRSIARNPNSFVYQFPNTFHSKPGDNFSRIVTAPAFNLKRADLNGYIRINLRGREKDGIVEPGEEYDQLCSAITEDLKTFVDVDTGVRVVDQVLRSDGLFKSGSRLNFLPDLIVIWSSSPSINQRAIVSNRYPSLFISAPKRNLDGRSGNHSSEGFLIAVGNGMPPNSKIENGDILDLAPTICALLGVHKPMQMRGNSLWSDNKDI